MKTAIIDYGMGNLHSVFQSVQAAAERERITTDIVLTSRASDIFAADRVLFPGQGAMPDCMAALQRSGLDDAVRHALRNKPFFGICVGAQLLFEYSEEGNTQGLGWFSGSVKRFVANQTDTQGNRLKVPHMGWNTIHQTQPHSLFKHIAQDSYCYFVHSYYIVPTLPEITLATSEYPHSFACIVGKDNVFATQFHSEKSHDSGLQLLQNFLTWRI